MPNQNLSYSCNTYSETHCADHLLSLMASLYIFSAGIVQFSASNNNLEGDCECLSFGTLQGILLSSMWNLIEFHIFYHFTSQDFYERGFVFKKIYYYSYRTELFNELSKWMMIFFVWNISLTFTWLVFSSVMMSAYYKKQPLFRLFRQFKIDSISSHSHCSTK